MPLSKSDHYPSPTLKFATGHITGKSPNYSNLTLDVFLKRHDVLTGMTLCTCQAHFACAKMKQLMPAPSMPVTVANVTCSHFKCINIFNISNCWEPKSTCIGPFQTQGHPPAKLQTIVVDVCRISYKNTVVVDIMTA